MNNIKIAAIIPARMDSTRFPGKPLLKIDNLPMIEHVRRRVSLCKGFSDIIVTTCDKEIKDVVNYYGGKVIMTSKKHLMASDRVNEAAQKINCTHIVNVQGDEILVMPSDLEKMIKFMRKNSQINFFNAVSDIENIRQLNDKNIVKCITSIDNKIIFCSRMFDKSILDNEHKPCKKILGILGYSKKGLKIFSKLKRTKFEIINSIDQSRLIESNLSIQGINFDYGYIGINDNNEKKEVLKIMKRDKYQTDILTIINK